MRWLLLALALCLPATAGADEGPWLVVLGVAQDGGVPQAGDRDHPGWHDPAQRRLAASLGLVDPASGERWIFDATPDFAEQLQRLDELAPPPQGARPPALAGILLTHAHRGHYAGLLELAHETMGASGVPVYAMPRMRGFLQANGPWEQMVRYGNIELRALAAGVRVRLNERVSVLPLEVPHRPEYSEVVGFVIEGPQRRALYLPDIDSWEDWDEWGTRVEDVLAGVDVAYLDATFYADGELPGRDMSAIPHPMITHSMERFAPLPARERAKVRFIHLNHTNPAHWPGSGARAAVEAAGFAVCVEGERFEL